MKGLDFKLTRFCIRVAAALGYEMSDLARDAADPVGGDGYATELAAVKAGYPESIEH